MGPAIDLSQSLPTSRKTLASAGGDHLRMHRPVAAVPGVAHLVPSVAPLAHTNEIRASSSAQRTVSVPVTTRSACAGPALPSGPEARRDLADPVRRPDPLGLADLVRRVDPPGLVDPLRRPDPLGLVDPTRVGRIPRQRVS